MKDEVIKWTFNAKLVVDKLDPKELIDLYVTEEEFRFLCRLFGSNRTTFALRMKGIG